jgi:hypothetical protein
MIANITKIITTTLVLIALAPTTSALASGSMGGGAMNGMKLGQSVYARKIVCKSCKFPEGLKSQEQKSSALSMIDAGEISLSELESTVVKNYISRLKVN